MASPSQTFSAGFLNSCYPQAPAVLLVPLAEIGSSQEKLEIGKFSCDENGKNFPRD